MMLFRASLHTIDQRMVWKRHVLATLVVLATLLSLAAPLFVSRWHWLLVIVPGMDVQDLLWEPGEGLVLAILIPPLVWALIRGKRQAWWLTVISVTLSLLMSILERSHWLSLTLTLLVLLLLLWYGPLFFTRSEPRTLLPGYLAVGLSGFCVLGTDLFVWLAPHSTRVVVFLSQAGIAIGLHLLAFPLLGYGLFALLQPVQEPRTAPQSKERRQAHAILVREGHVSLGHFALSEEKRYFWSTTGHSFLAYVVHAGVALVLSEPIGPVTERETLLQSFLQHCQYQDWTPALYQAGSATTHLCQTTGMHAYKIGEEALVNLSTFTLQGKKGAPVRHAVARAKRDHLTIHCWQGEALPQQVFAGMQRVSRHWEEDHQITQQMRFSMGRFPEDWSPDLLTVVACDTHGEVQAFLTWVPMYAAAGWALDLMRRNAQATPGTMEYLIVESLEWARLHGAEHLSLGLAPLAGLSEDRDGCRRSALERRAAWLHQRGFLLGHYRSLRAFKAKFQPDWQERYLIVQQRTSLPKVLLVFAWIQGYSWKVLASEGSKFFHRFLHQKQHETLPPAQDERQTKPSVCNSSEGV